jgi:long-chain acyl-CoA synthetase
MVITMASRPEHWVLDLAAVHAGAVPCTAYATSSPTQLRFLARHSKARVLVLEGAGQLDKWRPVLDELPDVVAIVLLDDSVRPAGDARFVSHVDLLAAGAAAHRAEPGAFEAWTDAVRPEDPVALLYTSGTTGDPKGVVLSNHNAVYQAVAALAMVPTPEGTPTVSYLPLAHIADRVLSIYSPVYRAGHVYICAHPGQLAESLRAVRPTSLFGVPRFWEKAAAGLATYLAGAPAAHREAYDRASALALSAYRLRADRRPVPPGLAAELAAADTAVLAPMRAMLGLDRVVWAGSGAAPIPVAVLLFLAGIGLDVLEVWGMTETTGSVTVNTATVFRTGSVGRPNPGMAVRIADDGEILVRGPLVCLGYLQPDGSVLAATGADGWLATGDVGTLDTDGFLRITDRKKELLITSNGKNVSPAQIENLLRVNPLIGNALAVGDNRPYITALLVLDEETVAHWAKAHGIEETDLATLAAHPAVRAELAGAVAAANAELSRPEQVKRFHVVPGTWSPESGELTPTQKLRRRVIVARHGEDIEALYA